MSDNHTTHFGKYASYIPTWLSTSATHVGFGSNVAAIKVSEQESAQSYYKFKNKLQTGIVEEQKNDKFSQDFCGFVNFAKDLRSLIDTGRILLPTGESAAGYEKFKSILDNIDENKNCKLSGGKFYKLKGKSKKYKSKKLFRKSKKLVKKVRQMK